MIWLIIFLFALFAMFVGYACCAVAGRADDHAETYWRSRQFSDTKEQSQCK